METTKTLGKNKKPSKLWEFIQQLGKTFMLPVALLAATGLLLGVGSSFSSASTIQALPFLGNSVLQVIFKFLASVGGFGFTYLPVTFAMAIPIGLCNKEKGIAAFSGFVGFAVMHLSINFYLTTSGRLAAAGKLAEAGQSTVIGIQTLNMGVLGGIIAGLIVYKLHNRFYRIQLPDSFAFFSGVRFVPIITAVVMSGVGILIPFIWPIIATLINGLGTVIYGSGIFGPFLFFSAERLLIPTGLHQILVSTIRFTAAGGHQIVNGKEIYGALNIFYAQLQGGTKISPSVTVFLSQGKMPTFMFGLPGAALAMYHAAPLANRKKIKGLLLSGFFATFVTGITEPIEFLFLFISPFLWVFHIIMTGLGAMTMALFGVTIGNTDGGVLDFFVFGVMQGFYTRWYLVPIVGMIWFFAYYFVFKTAIIKFNIKTPGREGVEEAAYTEKELNFVGKSDYDIVGILNALGGTKNIEVLDNCVTRLRLVLSDGSKVEDEKLKQLGALGVMHLDEKHVQVVIGTKVTTVRNQLEDLIG
ncbi:MAG: maltose/glucose-specific PTS transporter subunit IIBC [Streptococcaceae bacterium]|jgi:PTS system maltose and glucose-specific IIC component|nr:maltose/glucose-specific PTS transporter subunit IIBC [Streptococcaceae bacterium]